MDFYGYGKENHPPIFNLVFDDDVTLKDIKNGLVSDENGASLKNYILENVDDLAKQFDSIKDLKNVDDDILKKGLIMALNDNKKGDFIKK